MSNDNQPKKNLQDIKDIANSLPKKPGERHMDRLNQAAQDEGFQCWNHARNVFAAKAASNPPVNIEFMFKWYDERRPAFWERVGHLQVRVTPVAGFPETSLQRIVFQMPEFWTEVSASGHSHEHFRIDSAYFHRVTNSGYHRDSQRVQRNVLSFHLLDSQWHATIFDYGTKLSQKEMEREIESALKAHFEKTISEYQCNMLGAFRVLPKDVHEEMASMMAPTSRQYAASFLHPSA